MVGLGLGSGDYEPVVVCVAPASALASSAAGFPPYQVVPGTVTGDGELVAVVAIHTYVAPVPIEKENIASACANEFVAAIATGASVAAACAD